MDKKEILKDLLSIVYSAGLCSGAWDDEYGRDKPVEEFLNTMKHFAEKYNIHIPELKEFKNPKDDIDSYQVKDALASHLQYELEEKLKRELL